MKFYDMRDPRERSIPDEDLQAVLLEVDLERARSMLEVVEKFKARAREIKGGEDDQLWLQAIQELIGAEGAQLAQMNRLDMLTEDWLDQRLLAEVERIKVSQRVKERVLGRE